MNNYISKVVVGGENNNQLYYVKDSEARIAIDGKQDALVSGSHIKTLNNESLLGSGNISITPVTNNVYVEDDQQMAEAVELLLSTKQDTLTAGRGIVINDDAVSAVTDVVEQNAMSASILPDVLNKWTSPINSLSITLLNGVPGKAWEYMLEFTVGNNNFVFSCNNIQWVDDNEPDWTAGYTYQVSILNGLAVSAGWTNTSQNN